MGFRALRQLAWSAAWLVLAGLASTCRADTVASLLGNFTINQFCGVAIQRDAIQVHYAVVYGQLPALSELHNADADRDGVTTQRERDTYVGTLAPGFADGLKVMVDGARVPLHAVRWSSSLPTEQGGFSLRVDVEYAATLTTPLSAGTRRLQFSNDNYPGRMGWHEIVVTPARGVAVFDTDAYGSSLTGGLTEALRALPEGGPLDERAIEMAVSAGGVPAGARGLQARPGTEKGKPAAAGAPQPAESAWLAKKTRELVAAISAPRLEPRVALWALLAALILGAIHALSPGHGKTIVGAYLIGSRGTPRHAAFLGLTVTVTHTLGVFVVGFATLYASRFIVPEKLFPILSLISALLVLGMGLALLVQRGRAASRELRHRGAPAAMVFHPLDAAGAAAGPGSGVVHAHGGHVHVSGAMHSHGGGVMHSHGGGVMHSHLPPGAAGERVTWKNLLTLGISGGLVPCPSAMVLLLAAVALNKTAYGLLLVLDFSVGLALTLTAVGLAFLYARNRFRGSRPAGRWSQLLPLLSAAAITMVGVVLCVGALRTFS
jgi:ABC-type nickel/cobalt efflux system permease component RcnA